MRRLRTTGCLLLACLAAFATAVRADEDRTDPARFARRLASPVAAERGDAVLDAAAHGGAARTWARAWVRSPDPELRAGGWRVLGRVGAGADLRAALVAMADPEPDVARRAAASVVGLAATLPLEAEPWICEGALRPAQVRALAYALAARLDEAPAGSVPTWLTRLGGGVAPCLTHVLLHPRFDRGPRRTAIAALAALGGDGARRALSALIPRLQERGDTSLWEAWWRALVEVGPGEGLEGAHELVVQFAQFSRRGRSRPPGLRWRSRVYFYRFIATCPPAEGLAAVRKYIDLELERAAQAGPYRLWPSLAGDVVRAHLVIAEPNDERLEWDVLAARPPPRNGWRRRQEELGAVLANLEPYKARAGLQKGISKLLRREDLPKTVKAWALYLQGETPPDELRAMAARLIDADGAAATLAQRRLGARLLDRLGEPGPERIRAMLRDLDGWMRGMGLRWAVRAVAAGALPAAERAAAVRRALGDQDRGTFLLAAELKAQTLGPASCQRVLQVAVGGPRSLRGRAWRVIATALGSADSPGEEPFVSPGAHAGVDVRLRAAAQARRLWGTRRR